MHNNAQDRPARLIRDAKAPRNNSKKKEVRIQTQNIAAHDLRG